MKIKALSFKLHSKFNVCLHFQGQCVCEAGFTLSDCSARTDTPPEITVMKNKGLCDSSVSNCTKISVYGPDIDVAGDVYCKVQPFLVCLNLYFFKAY